ncbi:MAG: hypothetical protein HZB50_14395 [Chloroflexi bacterium]|nr:hypothetical protein [Chloroflexota bacterium]
MKTRNIFITASASLVILSLASCSALIPPPKHPDPTRTADGIPSTAFQYHFVTDQLILPATQELTQMFALNVDGDPQNQSDNLFGELLTMFTSAVPGLELQASMDQAMNTDRVVSLHVVKANDPLNASNVSWTLLQGKRNDMTPNSGIEEFTLDSTATANPPIIGSLTNGHFMGGPGTAQIHMSLLGQLVEMNLIGIRLEADLSAEGCANGKLGGAMTVDEFHNNVLPVVAEGLNRMVKADQTVTAPLLQTFDSDHNGAITLQELENNIFLSLALSPDLDLLDASGKYNPRQDGVKDSYSVGLGFTCIPAAFSAPELLLVP